jgi:hypothetical protein
MTTMAGIMSREDMERHAERIIKAKADVWTAFALIVTMLSAVLLCSMIVLAIYGLLWLWHHR